MCVELEAVLVLDMHNLARPRRLNSHTSRVHLQVPHIIPSRDNERITQSASILWAFLQDFKIRYGIVLIGVVRQEHIDVVLNGFLRKLVE